MRYLLDAMLGNFGPYLRLCGHDAAYALERDTEADDALLALATEEDRTLVTRDAHLAARAEDSILLHERDTEPQLRELAAAGVDLTPTEEPTYCGRCNGRLVSAADERDAGEPTAHPDYVPDDADPVWRCTDCGQRFWRGSHWDRMVATLADARTATAEESTEQ